MPSADELQLPALCESISNFGLAVSTVPWPALRKLETGSQALPSLFSSREPRHSAGLGFLLSKTKHERLAKKNRFRVLGFGVSGFRAWGFGALGLRAYSTADTPKLRWLSPHA